MLFIHCISFKATDEFASCYNNSAMSFFSTENFENIVTKSNGDVGMNDGIIT